MKLTTKLLGAACGVALFAMASPAMAVNGNVSGSYANLNVGGGSGDVWNIGGSLEGMFSDQWGMQGDASYHSISGGGGNDWDFGGNVIWAPSSNMRFNGNVTYHNLSSFFGSGDLTTYGVGAEFFAGDSFTIDVKGGGVTGSGASGGYIGGQAGWYVMPDLKLSGQVDYLDSGGSVTSEDITAEWLVSESTPISVYGGYQHTNAGGGTDINVWFVGVKLYVNDSSDGSLVARQRSGALGYTAQDPLFIGQY